jgi:AAA+ ATPase superfamily predicted ATPase
VKFYGRKEELNALRGIQRTSKKTARFTLLTGRRRVGKTALLREAYGAGQWLYLFVSRKSEALLCGEFQREAQVTLGVPIPGRMERIKDLLEALFIYAQNIPLTLVIDEFQDLARINKGLFSEIQDLWDRYKDSTKLNLVVCGSVYSLLIKLFEDDKEPLFGRLTAKMVLRPLTPSVIKQVLAEHDESYDAEDLLCSYLLSGGVPRFLALLMDAEATTQQKMLEYVFSAGSPFLSEGRDILVAEFGRDYATYFSVLQLISMNKTSQSEIDSVLQKTSAPYLANLENEYSLVARQKPLFSKPGSRNNRWRILDTYLSFWFRFIYANQTLVEQQRFDLLLEIAKRDYNPVTGLVLEDYFKAKVMEKGRFTTVGSYWDRKGENQIDLIALSELDKTALVAEVKRSPSHIDLAVLKAKASTLKDELADLRVTYKGLSMSDM